MKKLNDIKKENNFKTPDGYFDALNNEIKDKIKNDVQQKNTPLFQIFKPYIYIAASLILLASGIRFGLHTFVDPKPKIGVSNSETIANVENSDLLYELYADDMVFYEYLNDTEELYTANNIKDEEIEEYLSQYYIEYELLYE
ncbi:MAG: hypothetical protein PHW82_03140 [Bacteroidales bacterium]|nr:hypothetical protein [Bacteroidales bacterium]